LRFLFTTTYYTTFLETFYGKQPDLQYQPYSAQMTALIEQCFGDSDYYSFNVEKLGHEARDIIINCAPLQKQWALEHDLKLEPDKIKIGLGRKRGIPIPKLHQIQSWLRQILVNQIKSYRPDVLYVHDPALIGQLNLFEEVRPYVKLIVAQIASTLPPLVHFRGYDLIISSLPNQVAYFQQAGIKSHYLPLAFESRILERLGHVSPQYEVVHVGGYAGIHKERTDLLEQVAQSVEVDFWGYGVDKLLPQSPIKQNYQGEAWGLEMFRIRAAARITLTKHISLVAENYANNMTLFETTGVGSLLITDAKSNLADLFEPGKEVIAYANQEDCIEKIRYYLEHEEERTALARNGQIRTLHEHTYALRMQQLIDVVKAYL